MFKKTVFFLQQHSSGFTMMETTGVADTAFPFGRGRGVRGRGRGRAFNNGQGGTSTRSILISKTELQGSMSNMSFTQEDLEHMVTATVDTVSFFSLNKMYFSLYLI